MRYRRRAVWQLGNWAIGQLGSLAVLGFAAGAALSAQTLPQQAPQTPQAPIVRTASIAGRVVDAETDSPIAGATVRLQSRLLAAAAGRGGRGGPQPLSGAEQAASTGQDLVVTDSDGNFVFHDLPKGPAQLTATAPGYIVSNSTEGRVYAPQRPTVLEDGQHVANIVIRMRKHATITGQIVDEAGEPVVGFSVRALRRDLQNGIARLVPSGTSVTDDRGIYRIDGLVPAMYAVLAPQTQMTMSAAMADASVSQVLGAGAASALMDLMAGSAVGASVTGGLRVGDQLLQLGGGPGGSRTAGPPVVNGRVSVFPTSYFPGVLQASQATLITLTSGEERSGVDWQVRPTPAARVSGVISGPEGPAANQMVRLLTSPGTALDDLTPVATTSATADGSFVFLGVPQGQYVVKAQRNTGQGFGGFAPVAVAGQMMNIASARGAAPREALIAQMPIGVGDRDVAGIALILKPGAKVIGRVEFEGSAVKPTPQQLQAMQVNLSALEGGQQGGGSPITAEALFTSTGQPPGRYNLTIGGSPVQPWTLRSVTVGGRDVTMTGIELAETDVTDVVATFTDRPASVSGTVRVPSGELPPSSVLLIPADYRAWVGAGMNPRGTRTVQVQPNGAFNLANLPPADYLLIAAPDLELDTERDLPFLDAMARGATRVTVMDGDKKTLDLQLVRRIR